MKFQQGWVNAEPQKWWGWTVKINHTDVWLALGAFASLEVLLLVICFFSCVIYIVKPYLGILLINNFNSVLDSSPECCESCFRLEFCIKWEQASTTNCAMIKSSLVLGPEHACKRSLHWFGFDEEVLMGWKVDSLCLIISLPDKIIDEMGLSHWSIENTLFKVLVFPDLVNDREVLPGQYFVH